MTNGQSIARSRHLEELARAAKRYTLQEILDVTEALAAELGGLSSYDDFTGATSVSGGTSGLVPAPQIGDEEKFLRGDGSWATVESSETNIAVFTGATTADGTSGLVPAPQAGDEEKFLRGDGSWATVESGSSGGGGVDYVIGSKVSSVEGGFWQGAFNDTPVLKLRHGDYEYNFTYDNITYLGGASAPLVTVTPDTYILGTASVSSEGGVWYEVNNDVPTLNLHAGNFNYSFNYDRITYKGGNANLQAYLPFNNSPTADACGNVWTATGNPTIVDGALYLDGSSYLRCDISNANFNGDWTIDFWVTLEANELYHGMFGMGTGSGVSNLGEGLYDYTGHNIWYFKDNVITANDLALNTRHHIAACADSNSIRLFVDGVKFYEKTDATWEFGAPVYIGAINGGFPMKGKIEKFRIFNRTLWTSNFTPPTAEDYL